jgi:HSP20 family molecular chaperone IbpA
MVKKQSMSSFKVIRTLPVPIDEQGVTAVIENDVLKIILPKKTERKKTIKVVQK